MLLNSELGQAPWFRHGCNLIMARATQVSVSGMPFFRARPTTDSGCVPYRALDKNFRPFDKALELPCVRGTTTHCQPDLLYRCAAGESRLYKTCCAAGTAVDLSRSTATRNRLEDNTCRVTIASPLALCIHKTSIRHELPILCPSPGRLLFASET